PWWGGGRRRGRGRRGRGWPGAPGGGPVPARTGGGRGPTGRRRRPGRGRPAQGGRSAPRWRPSPRRRPATCGIRAGDSRPRSRGSRSPGYRPLLDRRRAGSWRASPGGERGEGARQPPPGAGLRPVVVELGVVVRQVVPVELSRVLRFVRGIAGTRVPGRMSVLAHTGDLKFRRLGMS